MKKNITKLLVIALSLVLLIGAAVGVTVSATDTAVAPEIVSYNVSHENEFRLLFAVQKDTVTADDLTVTVTDAAGEVVDTVVLTGDALAATVFTLDGVECYKVKTNNGIAAKDMADQYYITVSSGDNASTVRYSLAEYCYQRLYKDGIINAAAGTKDEVRKNLYLSTLQYGIDAQDLLVNWADDNADAEETSLADYYYIAVNGGGTIDGTYSAGIYTGGTTFTLSADGAKKWYAVKADGTSTLYNNGTEVTVSEHTVFTPAETGLGEYADYAEDFNDFTPTVSMGSIVTDDKGNSYYHIEGSNQTEKFYITNPDDDGTGDMYIAEFDIRFNAPKSSDGVINYSGFYSSETSLLTNQSSRFAFNYDSTADKAGIGWNSATQAVTFETGVWYNVRLQVALNGSGKTAYIYVDNTLIATKSADSTNSLGTLGYYAFGVRNKGSNNIDIDNMYVGTGIDGHRGQGLYADKAENFDEYTATGSGILTSATDSYLKVYGGSQQEYFYLTESDDLGTDEVFVFEQDLRINGSGIPSQDILTYMSMAYDGGLNDDGVQQYPTIHDESTRLQYKYVAGEGYSLCGYHLNVGEWYTIRMEIRQIENADGTWEIQQDLYINNEFVYTFDNGPKTAERTLCVFIFGTRSYANGMNWDIDNVYLGSVTEEEAAAAMAQ